MKINILTIFPNLYEEFINEAMMKKAVNNDIVTFNIIDFREYSDNKHSKVDDYVYGPGAGMLLTAQPIVNALKVNGLQDTFIINPSPRGQVFNQKMAFELSQLDEVTFIVGRYEGIDQRVIDKYVNKEVSIGDFVVTGGEIPSQAIIEAVVRLIPGVLNKNESFQTESFEDGLLEEDQYTRPAIFEDMEVPEVLLNGHHEQIKEWKLQNKIEVTKRNRKDLYDKYIK